MFHPHSPSRRAFLRRCLAGAAVGGLQLGAGEVLAAPGYRPTAGTPDARRRVALNIARAPLTIDGRTVETTLIDGSLPGPLLRFREGDEVEIAVTNHLDEDTSLHWHGILLPTGMDGVPGFSFPGIAPGETFVYRYRLRQYGTYWYHSHSGFQEQTGVYGPLVIDAAGQAPVAWDREHVLLLSDWTFDDPADVLLRLKQQAHYYNWGRPTLAGLFAAEEPGAELQQRTMWAGMRMDASDLADVSAATYRYLLNGHTPAMGWRGAFTPGERVLLRLINGSAMSILDFRIPGLVLTVVAADGQPVVPVATDEIRIGVAETYDVIVEPREAGAYALFAESLDRSGFALGTLATGPAELAAPPARRPRVRRDMRDMSMPGHDHDAHPTQSAGTAGEHAGHHQHHAASPAWTHGPDHHGAGNSMIAYAATNRLAEPGIGLDDAPHRVLRYSELQAPATWPDQRPPGRTIELHLTGNMERYMWSFDGVAFSEVDGPIELAHGERVRLVLVNDTMMEHPIHLHGLWMELENGHGALNPRKHTILVKPNERLGVLVSATEPGLWAFHCHLLYHMEMGMFRAVRVA
ncbi:MAG: copper resistance system multicopper oxidase [Gammaproteobacteria bacterium]